MSSACHSLLALALGLFLAGVAEARELKVCADPNNLPFSNEAGEGFENRIAKIVADDLGAELTFVWWAQRRGQITNALNTGLCDLIPGISDVPGLLLTYPPYYRSAYSVVTPSGIAPITSLDDPALRTLRIGVPLVGDEDATTPPAAALARRGIIGNVRGYSVIADYSQPNPPARIIEAVAAGEVDVAIAWGPMAGYFATRQARPLTVAPLTAPFDTGNLPLGFDISMGLRLDEGALRKDVEAALQRRKPEIDAVLAEYGVPRLDVQAPL